MPAVSGMRFGGAVTAWRSSRIGVAVDHCPAALDFQDKGAWYPRDQFAVGTAAHAVLEASGRETTLKGAWLTPEERGAVAERVAAELVREGRSFAGRPEPPLPVDAVARGVELALDYQRSCPLDPSFRYELVLAVDRDFRPVAEDDPKVWLLCALDAVGYRDPNFLDDEDPLPGRCVAVDDLKSSWAADADELHTLQRMIQAVVAWAHYGGEGLGLVLEILNLRRRKTYSLIIEPNEAEGEATLEAFKVAIRAAISALEVPKGEPRKASPGAGCVRCPYLAICPAAAETLAATDPLGDPGELAARYLVHTAEAERLRSLLQPMAEEEPIDLGDGRGLGWVPRPARKLKAGAAEAIAAEWSGRAVHGKPAADRDAHIVASLPGLVKALKPGVAGLESVAMVLYHNELTDFAQRRAAAVARWTTESIGRSWGVISPEAKE